MNQVFILTVIILIGQISPFEDITSNAERLRQKFEDKVLDQRLCVGMNVGTDFISKSLKTIMDKYVRFYNDPGKYPYKRRDKIRWKQVIDGQGKTLESYGLDIELHGSDEHNGIKFV